MEYKILVINTGSTSTKVSVFNGEDQIFNAEIVHNPEELNAQKTFDEQVAFRKNSIDNWLKGAGMDVSDIDAVAARGGTFGRVKSGAYLVDQKLIDSCRHSITFHDSNLSAPVAAMYAEAAGCNAYIYDAVCTDEVPPIARHMGLKGVERRIFSHTLNTRAVARAEAEKMGKKYEDCNIIVAHMGGGSSINLHCGGKIVDICCDDEGPMSTERVGKMNAYTVIDMCFSGKYATKEELKHELKSNGGLYSHIGTKDMRVVIRKMNEGDEYAELILNVMAYQLAKEIAALASAVKGKVDAIVFTGGCMHNDVFVQMVKERVDWIAPVAVYPGALEMEALMKGITRVLNGEEEAQLYPGNDVLFGMEY